MTNPKRKEKQFLEFCGLSCDWRLMRDFKKEGKNDYSPSDHRASFVRYGCLKDV